MTAKSSLPRVVNSKDSSPSMKVRPLVPDVDVPGVEWRTRSSPSTSSTAPGARGSAQPPRIPRPPGPARARVPVQGQPGGEHQLRVADRMEHHARHLALDQRGVQVSRTDIGIVQQQPQVLDVGQHAQDNRPGQCAIQPSQRLAPVRTPGDDLGQHGVVVRGDGEALKQAGVHAHVLTRGFLAPAAACPSTA